MPDSDKVIKGLEKLRKDLGYGLPDRSNVVMEYLNSLTDALAMLKEQETKEVKESTNMYTGLPITHCPKCGVSLDRYLYGRQHEGQINYCPYCGQAVKFNA